MLRRLVGAALALGASAFEAHAVSVTIDAITGKWTSAAGAPVTGLNTSTIRWGTPIHWWAPRSGYRFTPVDTPAGPFEADVDSPFKLGTFTHLNYPIYAPSITGAVLTLTLEGTVSDGTEFDLTSVFEFRHNETPNTSSSCCRDIVTAIANPAKSTTLSIGGLTYLFAFGGFLVDGVPLGEFKTKEGQSNSAKILGSFVQIPGGPPLDPVPLPAALPLFASALGVAGLIGYRRKRKTAA